MPGLAVAPNPVANIAASNAAANSGSANGANGTNDAANGDASFSSALQRSMKSNSSDKPANSDTKTSDASSSTDASQTSTAAASDTPAADPLAALLPMLQGKFAQVAQTAQSADTKDKTKDAKDDAGTETGQDTLMASLAGTLAAQQQAAQPKVETKLDTPAEAGKAKIGTEPSVAGQAAILATEDAVNGQGRKLGDKETGEASFQTLLDGARAQQAQHNQEVRMAQPATHAETRIETPVGHERWTQEVGDKLTWMVTKQESSATLVLNPPHMGRVEVNVTINGDQANASFVSANPAVREALENALPRLKEVLADAGVQLGQAQVGAESRGDSSQNGERRDNRGHNNAVTGEFVPGIASSTSSAAGGTLQGNGMVDTFV